MAAFSIYVCYNPYVEVLIIRAFCHLKTTFFVSDKKVLQVKPLAIPATRLEEAFVSTSTKNGVVGVFLYPDLPTIFILCICIMENSQTSAQPLEQKPKKTIHKKFAIGFFCCSMILLILVIIIVAVSGGSGNGTNSSTKSNKTSTSTSNQAIDQFPHTKALLSSMQNSDGKAMLKNFSYDPVVQGINDTAKITVDLTMGTGDEGNPVQVKQYMAEVVKAVLHDDNANINEVWVTAYGQFVDKYGNTSNGILYQIYFNKSDASQINWNADSDTLTLTIIPGLWHVNTDNLN